jgi:hypothetical protein
MKRLETTLSETDYTAWKRFSQQTGKNSTHLLREFIQQAIQTSPIETASRDAKTLKSKKITVSFTTHEFNRVVGKVASEGYQTPTNWLRCLVMTVLHQDAVLTNTEISALEKLSHQLWAIGHNLNQITRTLNHNHQETNKLKLKMIQELKDLTLETRHAFSALVSRNKSRWFKHDV